MLVAQKSFLRISVYLTSAFFALFLLTGCTGSSKLETIKSDLLIPPDEFTYTIAFISIDQPAARAIFVTMEGQYTFLKETLLDLGFDVGLNPISIEKYAATDDGVSLLIECSYRSAQPFTREFEEGFLCSAFDLFNGEKVYQGEATMRYGPFIIPDVVTREGMRIALQQLPRAKDQKGRMLGASEAVMKLREK